MRWAAIVIVLGIVMASFGAAVVIFPGGANPPLSPWAVAGPFIVVGISLVILGVSRRRR
jgi:hypothetical protein